MSMSMFPGANPNPARASRIINAGNEDALRQSKLRRNDDLGESLDRLALVTNAMFELLQQAFPSLTVDMLVAKMREIDGRDGMYDNSTHRPPVRCPSPECAAIIPGDQARCQFCGADVQVANDPFAF